MPPTRREQLELDELLSDIYKGIETLPDNTSVDKPNYAATTTYKGGFWSRIAPVKRYELAASDPLVARHKQVLTAASRQNQVGVGGANSGAGDDYYSQPNKSIRQTTITTTTSTAREPQNFASGKRRVRIAEQPAAEIEAQHNQHHRHQLQSQHHQQSQQHQHQRQHQQRPVDGSDSVHNNPFDTKYVKVRADSDAADSELDDDELAQTATRQVQYVNENKLIYHDEQNAQQNAKPLYSSADAEHNYNYNNDNDQLHDQEQANDIDGVPRVEFYKTTWLDWQLGQASRRRSSRDLNERQAKEKAMIEELKRNLKNGALTLRQTNQSHYKNNLRQYNTISGATRTSTRYNSNNNNKNSNQSNKTGSLYQSQAQNVYWSPSPGQKQSQQNHSQNQSKTQVTKTTITTTQQHYYQKPDIYSQTNTAARNTETLSSIPSATEVVRSALYHQNQQRAPSEASMDTLNKTINLLPASPTPTNGSAPCSPVPQLRSPAGSPAPLHKDARQQANVYYTDSSRQRLTGTRILTPTPPQQPQQQQQQSQNQNQHQQTYANPHAALMQHKAQQQPRNSASIREFNELDNLLKSLNPNRLEPTTALPAQSNRTGAGLQAGHQVHVQPSTGSAPSRPSFGFGGASSAYNVTPPGQDQNQNQPPVSDCGPSLLPSMEDYQNIEKLSPVNNRFWYKPAMSRARAIDLLKDKPQGTFIVRDSTSFKGAFGLAVKVSKLPDNVINNAYLRNPSDPSADLIRHFLIEPTANGVHLKGYSNEPVFANLPALIYQHSLTQLALPCTLVIPRADIEDPHFNQKQRQFYNEFLASKEQARHQSYGATSPNGGYRRYPGDVLVHNEHRIIFE